MKAVQYFQIEENLPITGDDIGTLRESVGWEPLSEKYADALKTTHTHFSIKEPDLESFYISCGFKMIKAGSIKT